MNEKTDSVMGLTDIFKEEALPEVFKLVGEKLKTGPQAANDEEAWPSVAEVLPAPNANDYSVRSGQMQQYKGKWYPRPALTECGIVFTYPPMSKLLCCRHHSHCHQLCRGQRLAEVSVRKQYQLEVFLADGVTS